MRCKSNAFVPVHHHLPLAHDDAAPKIALAMAKGIAACRCRSSSSHIKLATSAVNIVNPIMTSRGSGEEMVVPMLISL
jgi:hypothetical protein